ncbi:class-III pyridoxal-phosphate-dependent aminotransferase [Lacticaseibacillus jixiensis]|uniref:class-III pyridoxal-phosphate-dependent aminotransferase n=1 Tax=Lacticaseibacillus jixiensis TaxID=3231926 RepID=UPI0036F28AA4
MITAHEIYDEADKLWNPGRVATIRQLGGELVMGKRGGSYFEDLDGHRFINMHSNGGVFNLGHMNPEVREALQHGADVVDAGNHYFPSQYKNALNEKLLAASPASMHYVFTLNGGGEAIDAAIKFARFATKKRRIISLNIAFHGSTGLAMAAGNPSIANFFNMPPDSAWNTHVPYNDLAALEAALADGDVAAVLIESIPATAGFPMPIKDYHRQVQALAHAYGALYIADEVQTGMQRSGEMWACCKFGAEPDMIVCGKGLSGGYYPMSAVIMNDRAASWMQQDGFAYTSSFNGTELGCIVASKVLDILARPATLNNRDMLTRTFANGLAKVQEHHADFLVEVRQCGVIMGLKTAHPLGGQALMQAMLQHGVWCMMADFDQSVLQFKPNLLMSQETALDVLDRLDAALTDAQSLVKQATAVH